MLDAMPFLLLVVFLTEHRPSPRYTKFLHRPLISLVA